MSKFSKFEVCVNILTISLLIVIITYDERSFLNLILCSLTSGDEKEILNNMIVKKVKFSFVNYIN
jgi:hypothetical protein